MAIFNSYLGLPEGISGPQRPSQINIWSICQCGKTSKYDSIFTGTHIVGGVHSHGFLWGYPHFYHPWIHFDGIVPFTKTIQRSWGYPHLWKAPFWGKQTLGVSFPTGSSVQTHLFQTKKLNTNCCSFKLNLTGANRQADTLPIGSLRCSTKTTQWKVWIPLVWAKSFPPLR